MKTKPLFAIVGTPIGNLNDISKRAIVALSEADIIFAEDTQKAMGLLNHLELKKKIISCHKDNEKNGIPKILNEIENRSQCVLISEAGMPCISDPGALVVRALIDEDIPFEIISGPTALIQGLIASGFSGDSFYFNGFPPHKTTEKRKLFENLRKIPAPIIFYESPHRIKETVALLLEYFPTSITSPIAISREMTKIYEETIFINNLEDIEKITEKGEFVIVVNNDIKEESEGLTIDIKSIACKLQTEGFTAQDIVKILKILGVKRNDAYRLANENKE